MIRHILRQPNSKSRCFLKKEGAICDRPFCAESLRDSIPAPQNISAGAGSRGMI
jgi:hypothetical protein